MPDKAKSTPPEKLDQAKKAKIVETLTLISYADGPFHEKAFALLADCYDPVELLHAVTKAVRPYWAGFNDPDGPDEDMVERQNQAIADAIQSLEEPATTSLKPMVSPHHEGGEQ